MKILNSAGEYSAVCFTDNRVYSGDVFRNVQPVEVELIVHAEEL